MPKKYHISTKVTPLQVDNVFKFKIVRGENCINCGKCTKVCIYEAHKRGKRDPRKMADPNTVVCRNCFRCIQECPRGALEKSIDMDFRNIGGSFWKPDMFITLFKQSEDGKVPVTGAGYRGPFTGEGFDGMWTDMSEIVRPTRDGIHGREYISTAVELGRKLNHLKFDENGKLISKINKTVDIPIPIIFDIPAEDISDNVLTALLKAASELSTFIIMPADDIGKDVEKYSGNIIPLIDLDNADEHKALLKNANLISFEYNAESKENFQKTRNRISKLSDAVAIVRVKAGNDIEDIVSALAHDGAEVIHVVTDYCGRGEDGRLVKDIIRSVHLRLVDEKIRDEVTLIFSGGISMAEHVPKAMLCGADLTAIDLPIMIGFGARLFEGPEKLLVFPVGLDKVPARTLTQRVINLMGAWHSQILEMMGAMGIREARRLRGETGRAIFFEDIDNDTFGRLFKKKEAVNL
ncbi:MAG TPA: glutamate synthase-related protein [Desulfomonilia bacterium]